MAWTKAALTASADALACLSQYHTGSSQPGDSRTQRLPVGDALKVPQWTVAVLEVLNRPGQADAELFKTADAGGDAAKVQVQLFRRMPGEEERSRVAAELWVLEI